MNKNNSIVREAPSQRRHYRIQSPITVICQNARYRAGNWSVGGFLLSGFEHETKVGDKLTVTISISFNEFKINFETVVKVTRFISEDKQVGCQFQSLDDRQLEILSHFANSLMQGEMAHVDETIQRLDIPVTLVSEKPDKDPNKKIPVIRKKAKSYLIGGGYLMVGAFLSFYAINALYQKIYSYELDNAIISAHERIIKSPQSGVVKEIYKNYGDVIKKGESLLVIHNDQITESVELARIRVLEAKSLLKEKQQKLKTQQEKLQSYREFGMDKLNIANARIDGIVKKIDLAEKRKSRLKNLHKSGMTSDESFDEIEEKIISLKADLLVAKAEQKISERAISETENGRFYTDHRLEGEVEELITLVESSARRVDLETQKYKLLQNRKSRLVLSSPSNGYITALYSNEQQPVSKGEPLYLLTHNDSRQIEAVVSSDELDTVKLGKNASAFIHGKKLSVTVHKIENVSYLEAQKEQRNYSGSASNNLLKVTLSFNSPKEQEFVNNLPSGLPVQLTFSRGSIKEDIPILAKISDFLFAAVKASE